MSTQSHGIQQIIGIEQAFDVNTLYYKETRIWALIRILLATHLNSDTVNQGYPVKTDHKLSAQHIRYNLQRVAKFASPIAKIRYQYLLNELKPQLERLSGQDFLIWNSPTDYVQEVDGKYFSPYLDPLIDLLDSVYSYANIEIVLSNNAIKTPKFYETYPLNILPFKTLRLFLENVIPIDGLQELCEVIYTVTGVETDHKRLEEIIASHFTYVNLFSDILKILRPRVVILKSYYSPLTMALITACKQLNIITVDSQHGVMDKEPSYSSWTRIPENGYEALPEFFWTWGLYGADTINEWRPENYPHHQAIIGGHLWLAYNDRLPATIGLDKLRQQVQQATKVILITLQYLTWDEIIPEHVLAAMQVAPSDYLWLIRLHPLHKQSNDIQKLTHDLEKPSISNYEIDISTEARLGEILLLSDVHLTRSSGTTYEALAKNVSSGIFHEKGLEYFETLVERGIVQPVLSTEAILAFIKQSGHISAEKQNYFAETDPEIAISAIKTILTKAK